MESTTFHESEVFAEDAVFIVGAGRFGGRAARLITRTSDVTVCVLDIDPNRLSLLDGLPVKRIPEDGIQFLVNHNGMLRPSHMIVPALPHHLAFEWLRERVSSECPVERMPVPERIREGLPHTWPGSDGSLLVSYADFVCPDDCPEPDHCTVTDEKRQPLHRLLAALEVPDYRVHVIRSHQLAPGLGGYRMADLKATEERLTGGGARKWLLGTSCRCHGILTALQMGKRTV